MNDKRPWPASRPRPLAVCTLRMFLLLAPFFYGVAVPVNYDNRGLMCRSYIMRALVIIAISVIIPSCHGLQRVPMIIKIIRSTIPPPRVRCPYCILTLTQGSLFTDKENYVDGTYWIDPLETGFKAVGSAEAPEATQMRGRGNTTWTYPKKPYKLKLGSKTDLLGMGKNKHWALLAQTSTYLCWITAASAFEMARQLDFGWVPQMQPVELILNGQYEGLYFLTETVRVDKNRVNITEQKDNETDPEKIPGGWLLECDNTIAVDVYSMPGHHLTHHVATHDTMTIDSLTEGGVYVVVATHKGVQDVVKVVIR